MPSNPTDTYLTASVFCMSQYDNPSVGESPGFPYVVGLIGDIKSLSSWRKEKVQQMTRRKIKKKSTRTQTSRSFSFPLSSSYFSSKCPECLRVSIKKMERVLCEEKTYLPYDVAHPQQPCPPLSCPGTPPPFRVIQPG